MTLRRMMWRVFPLLVTLLATQTVAQSRRHALIVGSNTGWAMDQPLRFAVEDARRLAQVLTSLGDFDPAEVTVLEDPTSEKLLAALAASEAAAQSAPGLFVFYYSGHADARWLHLGGAQLELEVLYRRLKAHPASVKVGLFDACQAGSLLAIKGARATSPFTVKLDDSVDVQGTAVLASSGADELSQETRALRGSFFTHHLLSGLRGAADVNADGKVSVLEVYEYAANRTTLDTAGTTAGAQRPVFRFDLKGRGEVVLTQRTQSNLTLDFQTDMGRCFVTDDAERLLLGEVPGGAPTRLSLPPGAYLVKCPTAETYRVAALMGSPGQAIAVKGLVFREYPMSSGVLKGSASGVGQSDKQVGFVALREGRPEAAIEAFNVALSKDLRDQEAFRGKAQALLALAVLADSRSAFSEAERLRTAAVRTDPRLADDPQFRSMLPSSQPVVVKKQDLAQSNLEAAFPRQHQRFGVGVSVVGPHGFLVISGDWVAREWLQVGLHLAPLLLGAGVSARVVPRSGNWSPYGAIGVNATLAGLGALNGPEAVVRFGMTEVAKRASWDRVAYLEGGVQFASRHWHGEVGVAVGATAPRDQTVGVSVFPVLTIRYFP
jgi:hypothetical protein